MFNEFLECTDDKDELETVTIVCGDCVMQVTLKELRETRSDNDLDYNEAWDNLMRGFWESILK